jgi:hypothetical protein
MTPVAGQIVTERAASRPGRCTIDASAGGGNVRNKSFTNCNGRDLVFAFSGLSD